MKVAKSPSPLPDSCSSASGSPTGARSVWEIPTKLPYPDPRFFATGFKKSAEVALDAANMGLNPNNWFAVNAIRAVANPGRGDYHNIADAISVLALAASPVIQPIQWMAGVFGVAAGLIGGAITGPLAGVELGVRAAQKAEQANAKTTEQVIWNTLHQKWDANLNVPPDQRLEVAVKQAFGTGFPWGPDANDMYRGYVDYDIFGSFHGSGGSGDRFARKSYPAPLPEGFSNAFDAILKRDAKAAAEAILGHKNCPTDFKGG